MAHQHLPNVGKDEVCRVSSDGSVKCGAVEQARVKVDAAKIFAQKWNRTHRPDTVMSKETSEFIDTLKKLGGRTLEVDRTYSDRIQLKYPPEMVYYINNGKNPVVGVDMEKNLVEMV